MSASPGALPAVLLADLHDRVFRLDGTASSRRMGAEIELIPLASETREPVPITAAEGISSLAFLRRWATGAGWREERSEHGPYFRRAGAGAISFEPGGQIEFSTDPFASAAELTRVLRSVVPPLRAAAVEAGIELLGVGLDPFHPIERVPMQLGSERYTRMAAYLATLGPAGARMMRQTASFQLNLDWPDQPLLAWRVLNAIAPYLIAIFANSPRYAGEPTGHRSYRAATWRDLDPGSTGVFPPSADPVRAYGDFALDARFLLRRAEGGETLPFRDWLERGAVPMDDWRAHLSTLFPEVRPKGYAELRSMDAIAPAWLAVPVVLLAGLIYHRPSLCAAADRFGPAEPALLERAGRLALADAGLADGARDLWEIGLAGAAPLAAEGFVDPADLEIARTFAERYTRQGRSPADDDLTIPSART